MSTPPNFYELLQVDRRATEDVIRAAHKAQMRTIHPDQANTPANMRRAQGLGEARQTLLDPTARRKYDAALQEQERAAQDARHAQAQQHQAENSYDQDQEETEQPRRRPRRAAPARPPRAPRERAYEPYELPQEPSPLLDFGRGLIQAGLRGANRKVAPIIEEKAEQAGEKLGERIAELFGGGAK